jgi:hypothetical protein
MSPPLLLGLWVLVDRLAICIDWLTAEDKWSNCLRTAPLLTMPATRRSLTLLSRCGRAGKEQ